MGQAKIRAKEIATLKSQPGREYAILAIRHCEDGSQEFAYFAANYSKPKNDKSALLNRICLNDWVHTPPAGNIAEYLFHTNTFAMTQQFPNAQAYIINFFEVDKEFTAKEGKKSYSCRDIMMTSKQNADKYAEALRDELTQTGTYSVKTNHYA